MTPNTLRSHLSSTASEWTHIQHSASSNPPPSVQARVLISSSLTLEGCSEKWDREMRQMWGHSDLWPPKYTQFILESICTYFNQIPWWTPLTFFSFSCFLLWCQETKSQITTGAQLRPPEFHPGGEKPQIGWKSELVQMLNNRSYFTNFVIFMNVLRGRSWFCSWVTRVIHISCAFPILCLPHVHLKMLCNQFSCQWWSLR